MPARASSTASSKTKPASHQASRSAGEKPSRFQAAGSEWSISDIIERLWRAESRHWRASSASKPLSDQVRATTGSKPAECQFMPSWGLKP